MLLALLPNLAHAWWNEDWAYRKKITLNTSPTGAATAQTVSELPLLVRLHTGSFTFLDANEDGGDLRFVAADDRTLLPYHIEQWDPVNELALIWVRVPSIAAGSSVDHIWLYSGNRNAQRIDDPAQRYDAAQVLVLHFNQPQGAPADYSAHAHAVAESTAVPNMQGPIDGAMTFDGTSVVRVAAAPSLRVGGSGFTFSAWVRIAGPQSALAQLYVQQDGSNGISVGLQGSTLVATAGGTSVQSAGDLQPNVWHHVAAVGGGGRLTLFLDGQPVGETTATLADIGGEVAIGRGLQGDLDEVQLASVARAPDWIKASWAAQGPEPRLISFGEDEQAAGGGHSYLNILLGAVTVDGWIVIVILMVMLVISFLVMIAKGVFVSRTERANRAFLQRFERDPIAMLDPKFAESAPKELSGSSLFRLYRLGLRELKVRLDQMDKSAAQRALSPQALGAIKASLDAGLVREGAQLNSQMVLLTIAISGGPFLGLLGTVVGVMITFAAIAAVGDVNVNSIAPGIAAALVATVAGLAVAIPALFGYNYLAARIKNVSNDMTVFADELVSRLAEKYAP